MREDEEEEEPRKGLRDENAERVPAPSAEAMLVGRGEALLELLRSESRLPRSLAAFQTVPPATRLAFLSPMFWPTSAGSMESGNSLSKNPGVGM